MRVPGEGGGLKRRLFTFGIQVLQDDSGVGYTLLRTRLGPRALYWNWNWPLELLLRNLTLILGDQLDRDSAALDGFDPTCDRIWMAEVVEESTHVWSHKARIALFLAAMRHFASEMRERDWPVDYLELAEHAHAGLGEALAAALAQHQPDRVVVVEPGDWRVLELLRATCTQAAIALEVRVDRHFMIPLDEIRTWAKGRKSWRLEHYYRWARQRTGVLMNGREPAGGRWNFDQENRHAFGAEGPGLKPEPRRFAPDAITAEVLALVARHFADHPGELAEFGWPVTPAQAEVALADFIDHRLAAFGPYQDALWSDEPWLYHSLLAAAMNLKLIDPRRVIAAAEQAWQEGRAPLASVEGFIRQILGWREYVRGIYWLHMPEYLEHNALAAEADLPPFYWTGTTDYECLRQSIGQTLKYGYAHHIQRLMVTGLFALLLGVRPKAVHAWYLAVYVDAVEWVELPNTLGMSQAADDGLMASKPYCATGKYIDRMSNYCGRCRYRPDQAVGEEACPFTTLYWDFLARHRQRFGKHPRTALQWRNLERKDPDELAAIRAWAARLRSELAGDP
jgi:deoxyribodipyrimidine photolyase-related protein